MELRLVQNALDFIIAGAVDAKDAYDREEEYPDEEETERDKAVQHSLKYAVLHMCAGVELLLKERLRREHWSLLFERPDEATQEKFESGDFRSVSLASLLQRLEGIAGLQFGAETRSLLESLKRQRNKLEHFEFRGNVEAIRSLVNRVASFALDFVHRDLKWKAEDDELIERMRVAMFDNGDFVATRMGELKDDIAGISDNFAALLPCPYCLQEAFEFSDGQCRCLFCHQVTDRKDAAQEWQLNFITIEPKERLAVERICPECGHEAFVQISKFIDRRNERIPDWLCFGCAYSASSKAIRICMKCSEPFLDCDGVGVLCSRCFHETVTSSHT
jgi:hypothetical protein